MAYYSVYWNRDMFERLEGESFGLVFGKHFRERGIVHGDVVFGIMKDGDSLCLVGAMTVERVLAGRQAIASLGQDPEVFEEAILGATGTSISFDRRIPVALADELVHYGSSKLRAATAHKLAALLFEPTIPEEVHPLLYSEGHTTKVTVNRFERDEAARLACIQHYGTNCVICGFSFRDTYGEQTNGIIHVHHITPLSEIGGKYEVDPIADLIPVCPNCHAVLHLKGGLKTPDEVRSMIEAARVIR